MKKRCDKQKKKYTDMEMDVLEIDESDIITKSDCYDCACNEPGECEKDYDYRPWSVIEEGVCIHFLLSDPAGDYCPAGFFRVKTKNEQV